MSFSKKLRASMQPLFRFIGTMALVHSSLGVADELHHTVFFKLIHEKNSVGEQIFFDETKKLSKIPSVNSFQIVNESSSKNNFDYGLIMTFSDQPAYHEYNRNPLHLKYVQEIWLPQVADFLELDWRLIEAYPGDAL